MCDSYLTAADIEERRISITASALEDIEARVTQGAQRVCDLKKELEQAEAAQKRTLQAKAELAASLQQLQASAATRVADAGARLTQAITMLMQCPGYDATAVGRQYPALYEAINRHNQQLTLPPPEAAPENPSPQHEEEPPTSPVYSTDDDATEKEQKPPHTDATGDEDDCDATRDHDTDDDKRCPMQNCPVPPAHDCSACHISYCGEHTPVQIPPSLYV